MLLLAAKPAADPESNPTQILTPNNESNLTHALGLGSMASDDDERVYYEDLASALAADGLELLAAKPS